MPTTLIWFGQDLRLHDNAALHLATEKQQPLICLFCINPRWFKKNHYGLCSMGQMRWHFLQQSLENLNQQLKEYRQTLYVAHGNPVRMIEQLIGQHHVDTVIRSEQYGYYEHLEWLALQQTLANRSNKIHCLTTASFTLFPPRVLHEKTLLQGLQFPSSFSQFRKKVEPLGLTLTHSLPQRLPPPPDVDLPVFRVSNPGNSHLFSGFHGGETSALEHLDRYFKSPAPLSYKQTRNELDGWDVSCKFSPWLANGSLSVRQVISLLRAYEYKKGANESTNWIYFELLWREYFQWYARHAGKRLYTFSGIERRKPLTSFYPHRFRQWCQGKTPWPLVNACINQLNTTGYLSNRGRQIVASCLVNELSLDWRCGAYYFEQQLVDYDPAVNWGNWQYIAGVGSDPRGGRHFDLVKQAQLYDPDGEYVHRWAGKHSDLAEPDTLDAADIVDWPVSP